MQRIEERFEDIVDRVAKESSGQEVYLVVLRMMQEIAQEMDRRYPAKIGSVDGY